MQLPLPDRFGETSRGRSLPDENEALVLNAPWTGGHVDKASPYPGRRLGEILVETGALLPANLDRALILQRDRAGLRGRTDRRLGAILLAEHMVDEAALARALALQKGVWRAPLPPGAGDTEGIEALGPDACLRLGVVPLSSPRGGRALVATARPHLFRAQRAQISAALGPVRMAIASEEEVAYAVLNGHAGALVELAEARPAPEFSLRGWSPRAMAAVVLTGLAAAVTAAAAAPAIAALALLCLAVAALAAASALRLAALLAVVFGAPPRAPRPEAALALLPRISLLIPLLREREVSDHLLSHLARLDYPTDRLDIVFATEAGDGDTLERLGHSLPFPARVVTLPAGTVRTKPRALNFALDFAMGDIVGVLDAEDAPEPGQLRVIAGHFAHTAPDVACLQGRLDFYNAGQNWLARCFAVDYAAWFRVVLPGLARLGFAIPLGGTTVYFRRDALERIGRWDAHNVTEDADLGIRLARLGYRTEIAETATAEEANCRLVPWIRQRSRWLKGYALTWAVHMRAPAKLWRDLGPKRFLGFQITFAGTVLSFLLAPILWSFWLIPLGLSHPVAEILPRNLLLALVFFFVCAELLYWITAGIALSARGDRWLLPWVPTTLLYFPLAALASYRALVEIAWRPFHWDKTRHGLSSGLPLRRGGASRARPRGRR